MRGTRSLPKADRAARALARPRRSARRGALALRRDRLGDGRVEAARRGVARVGGRAGEHRHGRLARLVGILAQPLAAHVGEQPREPLPAARARARRAADAARGAGPRAGELAARRGSAAS